MTSSSSSDDHRHLENPNPNPNPATQDPDDPPPEHRKPPGETLTLGIPDNEYPSQDDPEVFASPYPRRGTKRNKMGKRRVNQEKAWKKKQDALLKSLILVPFVPAMIFDIASRESLLRRVGLWDFVHIQFDTSLRVDLIAQLIVTFNRNTRVSYVNGVRIKVNRADLGRALSLPRKDKIVGGESLGEVKGSKEDVGFLEKLVMNWLLLHDDMWMMPNEVLHWMGLIKEGCFERVDWAGMIWFMVEKELLGKPVGNCYYASHLQCLIKHQRRELLEGSAVKMDADEEDEDASVSEDVSVGDRMEECVTGLSLGGLNDAVNDKDYAGTVVEGNLMNNEDKDDIMVDVKNEDKGELLIEENVAKDGDKDDLSSEEYVANEEDKEDIVTGENVADFQDGEEVEKIEPVITANMGRCILNRCNQIGSEGVDFEEDRKHGKIFEVEEEMKEVEDDGEEYNGEVGEEDYDNDEEEEEEDEEELDEEGFSITHRGHGFECVASENLISGMEAAQHQFTSELQMPNSGSGQFLMSSVEAQRIRDSSSLFGNHNVNKNEIEHIENDFPHNSLVGGNKRMRNDGPWETKMSSDMDMYMDQMQHLMEKCKMMYNAKEQVSQEMSMNQQLLLGELQRRDNVIQDLKEDAEKKKMEKYKLERELYMMSNILDGYRKALKGTQKAFADYRAKCQLPQEPIYKDTGIGGLVLSKMELEKQRLMREEEEKLSLSILKENILDFEAGLASEFGSHNSKVNWLSDKLCSLEKKVNLLKEKFARRRAIYMPVEGCKAVDLPESALNVERPESSLNVEGCMNIDVPEPAPNVEGSVTIGMPESAPNVEGSVTIGMPESAPNVEGSVTIGMPESAPNVEGSVTIGMPESAPNVEGSVTIGMPESSPNVEGSVSIGMPESAPNVEGSTICMPDSVPNVEG